MSEYAESIVNRLKQTIRKGDVVLSLNLYGVALYIVHRIKPILRGGAISLRYSRIFGIEISSRTRWDHEKGFYVVESPIIAEARKTYFTCINSVLRLDGIDELGKYGYDPAVIQLAHQEQQKVMRGDYDKKVKKKKENV